ncbi:TauD/TfdA family dioxygenase [Planctobacterium marinum]|uniref:TauD/TfdA family dioxygenase n=1 Tax=Planctobacterium marinum TaxID=1631968 RepID=UPI0030C71204
MPYITLKDLGIYLEVNPNCKDERLTNIDRQQIIEAYLDKGALLFRGFKTDQAIFRSFAQSFCDFSVFNGSKQRKLLDGKNNIQTVNLGFDEFPLNAELAKDPWKPEVCFFACLKPPTSGGQTTICDGIELVKRLDKKLDVNDQKRLKKNFLVYQNRATQEELDFWLNDKNDLSSIRSDCPFNFIKTKDGISSSYIVPALHKPMWKNQLAFGNLLLIARFRHKLKNFPFFGDGTLVSTELLQTVKDEAEQITHEVNWQESDVLMLDNSRHMHGRRAIVEDDQRLILSSCGYLNFAHESSYFIDGPWRKENWGHRLPVRLERY